MCGLIWRGYFYRVGVYTSRRVGREKTYLSRYPLNLLDKSEDDDTYYPILSPTTISAIITSNIFPTCNLTIHHHNRHHSPKQSAAHSSNINRVLETWAVEPTHPWSTFAAVVLVRNTREERRMGFIYLLPPSLYLNRPLSKRDLPRTRPAIPITLPLPSYIKTRLSQQPRHQSKKETKVDARPWTNQQAQSKTPAIPRIIIRHKSIPYISNHISPKSEANPLRPQQYPISIAMAIIIITIITSPTLLLVPTKYLRMK